MRKESWLARRLFAVLLVLASCSPAERQVTDILTDTITYLNRVYPPRNPKAAVAQVQDAEAIVKSLAKVCTAREDHLQALKLLNTILDAQIRIQGGENRGLEGERRAAVENLVQLMARCVNATQTDIRVQQMIKTTIRDTILDLSRRAAY